MKNRNRFTWEITSVAAHAGALEPKVEPTFDQEIDLYELGTGGLLDYVAGRSPFYPKIKLGGRHPSREWRLCRALIVVETRGGVDTGARKGFIAVADRLAA